MDVNLNSVLADSLALVQEVATYILNEGLSFDSKRIEYKGLNDLVSYVDREAERMLVDGLRLALPGAGFITEEGTEENSQKEYTWIIDPLDGTTNFIHGLPVFAISVALMKDANIVMGIVHEINRAESYYSVEGKDAFCNGEKINVSPNADLAAGLIATGFPYHDFQQLDQYLKMLQEVMEACHGIRRLGSAAVDLAFVACGRFEGFFEYNLNPWDVAAGAFLVKQAGGTVTDFSGGSEHIFGKQILAANGVHGEMLDIVRRRWE